MAGFAAELTVGLCCGPGADPASGSRSRCCRSKPCTGSDLHSRSARSSEPPERSLSSPPTGVAVAPQLVCGEVEEVTVRGPVEKLVLIAVLH